MHFIFWIHMRFCWKILNLKYFREKIGIHFLLSVENGDLKIVIKNVPIRMQEVISLYIITLFRNTSWMCVTKQWFSSYSVILLWCNSHVRFQLADRFGFFCTFFSAIARGDPLLWLKDSSVLTLFSHSSLWWVATVELVSLTFSDVLKYKYCLFQALQKWRMYIFLDNTSYNIHIWSCVS